MRNGNGKYRACQISHKKKKRISTRPSIEYHIQHTHILHTHIHIYDSVCVFEGGVVATFGACHFYLRESVLAISVHVILSLYARWLANRKYRHNHKYTPNSQGAIPAIHISGCICRHACFTKHTHAQPVRQTCAATLANSANFARAEKAIFHWDSISLVFDACKWMCLCVCVWVAMLLTHVAHPVSRWQRTARPCRVDGKYIKIMRSDAFASSTSTTICARDCVCLFVHVHDAWCAQSVLAEIQYYADAATLAPSLVHPIKMYVML